jgi:hypothetical protein
LIQVWSQWQIEIMTLVHGDAEDELRDISIRAIESPSLGRDRHIEFVELQMQGANRN